MGRRQGHAVRDFAGCGESSHGDGADSWRASRECSSHHQISWLGFWRKALSLASLGDGGGGGAALAEACEVEPFAAHDVFECGLSPALRTADEDWRHAGWKAAGAAP